MWPSRVTMLEVQDVYAVVVRVRKLGIRISGAHITNHRPQSRQAGVGQADGVSSIATDAVDRAWQVAAAPSAMSTTAEMILSPDADCTESLFPVAAGSNAALHRAGSSTHACSRPGGRPPFERPPHRCALPVRVVEGGPGSRSRSRPRIGLTRSTEEFRSIRRTGAGTAVKGAAVNRDGLALDAAVVPQLATKLRRLIICCDPWRTVHQIPIARTSFCFTLSASLQYTEVSIQPTEKSE
jgi:hypothetical protein